MLSLIARLTSILQIMEGSEGKTSSAIQARALMDRVDDLSMGGHSVQARQIFEELFVFVGDCVRLVAVLIRIVYQMEQYGGRGELSVQSPEEEMMESLFEDLAV